LDETLQGEAERQGVSVNVLVNKIFRKYSLFNRWIDRNNDLILPQKTFEKIIDSVAPEKLEKIATETGSFEAIDIFNMIGCPTN
jgi:hypothetical protein